MRLRAELLLWILFLTQSIVYAQQKPARENNDFTITKEVEEVVVYVTVTDKKNGFVRGLRPEDFSVFEDGKQQAVTSVRLEDTPIALGVVIDNSGSMRDKRSALKQAVLNLVRASNPQDQVFVVNFGKNYFLDQDFTSSIKDLEKALEVIESRGGTALYDAVVASANHLKKNGKLDKRVILVVTDGEDRDSEQTLERARQSLQDQKGIMVYAIGILGDERVRRAKRALNALAEGTGGIAFFPEDIGEVDAISNTIAYDIRNQYTINYKPDSLRTEGKQHTIRVAVHAKGHGKLSVRFRTSYVSGQPSESDKPIEQIE